MRSLLRCIVRPCWPASSVCIGVGCTTVRHLVPVYGICPLGMVLDATVRSSVLCGIYLCNGNSADGTMMPTTRREQMRLIHGDRNECSWSVGPYADSSPPSVSTGVSAVTFGSVRRREARRSERQIRNSAALESLARLEQIVEKPSAEEEQKAKDLLNNTYGFISKPPSCLYYRQFLSELRRYEMEWRMGSVRTVVFDFSMTDFGIDGKGLESVQMCLLRGEQNKNTSFAHMLGVVSQLFLMTPSEFEVPFVDEFNLKHSLVLRTVFPLGVSDITATDDSILLTKSDCQLAAERELEDELQKPFVAVPGGPYHRYLQRVDVDLLNSQSGSVKPLIRSMTVQAFTHCFIASVIRFVKRIEIESKPNIEFIGADDLAELRYGLVSMRCQIGLKPIDELELNAMLPPPTGK